MNPHSHADAIVRRYSAILTGSFGLDHEELARRLYRHAKTISGLDRDVAVALIERANAIAQRRAC